MESSWPRDERMVPCTGWQKRTIISDLMSCTLSSGGARGLRRRHGLSHERLARIQVLAVFDRCDLDKKQNATSIRLSWMMRCPLTMTREMPLSTGARLARCVNGLQDGRMIAVCQWPDQVMRHGRRRSRNRSRGKGYSRIAQVVPARVKMGEPVGNRSETKR
jgi:hypothetical protein